MGTLLDSATGRPPLDARPLVGRGDELALLDRLAFQVLSGRARVLAVEGVAGSGKTAFVAETLRRTLRDALVLRGRGGGSRAAPFLPFAMALRPLAEGADTVTRLLDGVTLGALDARVESGVQDAVAECMANAARRRPLALVLEDLDRSDLGTIGLIAHLASRLAYDDDRVRLMVLCTFRPGAPDGIDVALRRLIADQPVHHLPLRPLSEPELLQLLTELMGAKPSRALLREAVHESRGIPGRVEEIVRHLTAAGELIVRSSEVDLAVEHVHLPPPDGDLDRGTGRLAALSPDGRELMITAVLMGEGRPLDELGVALDLGAADFETHLNETFAAGCLFDHDDRIAFPDPSISDAVLHGIGLRQQRRRHALIAANLASAGIAATPGRITLVAHHLEAAGRSGAQFRELLNVGRAAGALALANGAYSTAARFYEAALSAAEDDASASATLISTLHLEAGIARFRDHDAHAALSHLERAVEGARADGHVEIWGRAVLALSTVITAHSTRSVGGAVGVDFAREFLANGATASSEMRARVLQRVSQAQFAAFAFDTALATADEAAAAAACSPDPTLHGDVEFARGLALLGTLRLDDACDALQRSAGHAITADDPWIKASALGRLPLVQWMKGDLAAAATSAAEALNFDRTTRNWSEWSLAAATAAGIALAHGDYGATEHLGAEGELLYRRSEHGFTTVVLYPALACSRALRGDIAAAHEALDAWAASGVWGSSLYRPLVDAFDGASESGDELRGTVPVESSLLSLTLGALSVELGDALDDEQLLDQGLRSVSAALERGVVWCPGWSFFLPRLAAVASWRLGRGDPAALFDRACGIAARSRAVGELARARSDAAAFWAGHDRERADTLDAKARQSFAELGLMALLRRRRDPETGGWTRAKPQMTLTERVFFFSDVVDSTGMTHRLGVQQYSFEVLLAHNNIVRGCLREASGIEFKHTGDGIAAWFSSDVEAIACGLEVQRRLTQFNEHHLGEPLRVRIGLSCGEVILDADEQLQGLALVKARRLCDLAHAEQVLVSEDLARRARSDRFRFHPVGEVTLKGFVQAEVVHVATWSSDALSTADRVRVPG